MNVPRRKQRGISWREQFKPFALSAEIGLLIKSLIEKNNAYLANLLNTSSLSHFEELPLFPNWNVIKREKLNFETIVKQPESHYTAAEFRSWLDKIVSNLKIPSERTGKSLRIFPTRLRRT